MNHLIIDYRDVKVNIYNDLYNEFKNDFSKWDAEINPQTLSIDSKNLMYYLRLVLKK